MKGYLGEIKYSSLRELPKGWEWCYGQYLDNIQYSNLNSIIAADKHKPGRFALPNLSRPDDVYRYMICIEGEYPYGDKEKP